MQKKIATLELEKQHLQEFFNHFEHTSKKIEQIEKNASKNDITAIFILEQIANYNLKRPRWSETTLRYCVAWRFASPKGYDLGRRLFIRAPCRSTIVKYVACPSIGITQLIR